MADTKISALTAATTLADTDELVLASAGASKKITGANLKASMPGGAAGALTLLSTTTLGANGTFDISSISGAYNDLIVILIGRSNNVSWDGAQLWVNNDTGANWYYEQIRANGSGVAAFESGAISYVTVGNIPSSGDAANMFASIEYLFPGYASTAWKKTFQLRAAAVYGTATGTYSNYVTNGYWNSTAAINRVSVRCQNSASNFFVAGSQLRIYGRL